MFPIYNNLDKQIQIMAIESHKNQSTKNKGTVMLKTFKVTITKIGNNPMLNEIIFVRTMKLKTLSSVFNTLRVIFRNNKIENLKNINVNIEQF